MPTTTTPGVDEGTAVPPKAPTLRWALTRALLAILILLFSISGVAWLLYASIDPEQKDVLAAHLLGRESACHPCDAPARVIGSEKRFEGSRAGIIRAVSSGSQLPLKNWPAGL